MNIYIDTNVLLSFYHLSSDDLEELKKLIVLLQQKKVILWLPEQTVIEFKRNRANKIADALKRLQEQRLSMQFPQLAKEYDEYGKLRKSLKESDEIFNKLINNIRNDIENQNLKADQIIRELMELAKEIKTDPKIVENARFRFDIGNPPGKKDSLGDAINWETLLKATPSDQPLYFISDDKDYTSPLGENLFEPYLENEWKSTKHSSIIYYKRLSSFFKIKFPDINLASEIAQAALLNTQVNWIIEDEDVNQFLKQIVKDYMSKIDSDYLVTLKIMLDSKDKDVNTDSFDDIPFDGIPAEDDLPF